ncbi:hypothetical protein KC921_01395 [Candidatus Woesebacteria bacterium]|nr:hypothetical protein [Candidatus Woesebacteria bacterium]
MLHDLIIVALSWFLFSITSLVSAPLVLRTLGKYLPDGGWAFTRVVGWLMIAIPIWFLAHVGMPLNTTAGIWILTLVLITISGFLFRKNQVSYMEQLQKIKPYIIAEEILFAFGLLFLCLLRGYQPDINGLEKFMDVGLMNSYLHSPTLPIADMWLAGHTFNYYTFGHYLGAVATQLIRQPLEISYNVMLAVLMGLTLSQTFGIVVLLIGKTKNLVKSISAGVLGALLVTFAGNSQPLWFFLKNHSFSGYWYPDATRFIPFTIHEFPAYSFIVSDLHAHVWSMILVLLLLPLVFVWSKLLLASAKVEKNKTDELPLWSLAIGSLLGIIASTSTWDTLIYGMLIGTISIILLFFTRFKIFKTLLIQGIIIAVSMLVAASPWFLSFTSISEGARLVVERSELWRFLTLWLSHIVVTAVALGLIVKTIWRKEQKEFHQVLFIVVLIITAWALLILPELVYMKDIYPSHPRANTMFKLTFQAFILMNIVLAWLFGSVQKLIAAPLQQKLLKAGLLVLSMALLIYPYFGYRDYYNILHGSYKGLDGLTWLKVSNPNDFAGIEWLRQNVSGQPVVLEAVGESYTTFARVSTFTSFPTVLGWRVHEWLWRGSFDIPGQRTTEVQTIYENPLSSEAQTKLAEYNVSYIFVGDKEREAYPNINEVQLKQLGRVVFSQGTTYIVHLDSATPMQSRPQ